MTTEPLPADTCLQCETTRAVVKANQYICGVMSGGETPELDHEWPTHRWADWKDKDISIFGILPEYFELYRRADLFQLAHASCVHLGQEHVKRGGDGDDILPPNLCPGCWEYIETAGAEE